jgi:uncharacterized protein YoaH (UPF0181 family)
MANTNQSKQNIENERDQVTQNRGSSEQVRAGDLEDTAQVSGASASGSVEGEGSYEAARDYGRGVREFVRSGRVEEAAEEAVQSLDENEQELSEAEEIGKSHAQGWEGASLASSDSSSASLDQLEPEARQRAMERISQLMAEGYSQRQAERIAVRLAEDWVDLGKDDGQPAVHVVHERNGWAVHAEDKNLDAIFDHMDDALRRAHEIAAQLHVPLRVHGPDGALIDKFDA